MKRYLSLGIIFLLTSVLSNCAYHKSPYVNNDLAEEKWQSKVDTTPHSWVPHADRWFYAGEPNDTEQASREAPPQAAMSTMMVNVPDTFTNVKVNGSFQVQIFGSYEHNSVFVYGANDAVREVSVQIKGNTLYLTQTKDAPRRIDRVIVRVGMMHLVKLNQMGRGLIEGRNIRSDNLCITSTGCGDVYLSGRVNLRQVVSQNKGIVTVLGAETPVLAIRTKGSGAVNISGNVGINSIVHHGSGDINIIGANSDDLKINTDGKGKIGIQGPINIRMINARDNTCVYATDVNSDALYVYATDKACLGLSGCAKYLNVDAGRYAGVQARYLFTQDAYVRAHDVAHVNVTASNKLFGAATQNASVYFFGSPGVMSQFVNGNGTVVPIFVPNAPQNATMFYCPYYQQATTGYKDQAPGAEISRPVHHYQAKSYRYRYDEKDEGAFSKRSSSSKKRMSYKAD